MNQERKKTVPIIDDSIKPGDGFKAYGTYPHPYQPAKEIRFEIAYRVVKVENEVAEVINQFTEQAVAERVPVDILASGRLGMLRFDEIHSRNLGRSRLTEHGIERLQARNK